MFIFWYILFGDKMLIDELKDVKSYFENDNEINIVLNTFDYLEHNEKSILANGYHFKEKKNRIFYYENTINRNRYYS